MINLINRFLVKLGLREPSITTDWIWFGGYGDTKKIVGDWIILK